MKNLKRDRVMVLFIGLIILIVGLVCKVKSPNYQALNNMGDIYVPIGLSTVILFANKLLKLTERNNGKVKLISFIAVLGIALISFYFAILKEKVNALLWVQLLESLGISIAVGFLFASFDSSLTEEGE